MYICYILMSLLLPWDTFVSACFSFIHSVLHINYAYSLNAIVFEFC